MSRQQIHVCEVEGNVDDTRTSMRYLLERLEPFLRESSPLSWSLDLRGCRFLGPDAAAMILATVLEARRQSQQVTTYLPDGPPSLLAFCEFSGLYHFFRGTPEPDRAHRNNVTVPLRIVRGSNFRDADPIIELIRRQAGISADSAEELRICVSEVVQNIEDHARSAIGGVTCARYFSQKREVRVAVVDRGEGIATTLRRRYHDIPDGQTALRRVIAGGHSARSRENNAGIGINHLWETLHRLHGKVILLSEDGVAEYRAGREDTIEGLPFRFPGTAVFFSLPIQPGPDPDVHHE